MDNEIFRRSYEEINERICPYEKALLSTQCNCSQAQRLCIGEREGVQCGSDPAQACCSGFLDWLAEAARFALHSTAGRAGLPHARAMKLQVGGLRGVRAALVPEAPVVTPIADVHALLERALLRYGDLASLPLPILIRQIAAYQGRPRGGRRRGN
jgi:hypothetical protein